VVSVNDAASNLNGIGTGYIGHIPVRNLWLLMLYASDLFRELGSSRIEFEENPDDIPDLIAEFLIHSVENRLRRNLSFGYQTRSSNLRRIRGRIDHLSNERYKLLSKGQIACIYDDLTIDTIRNRFVRGALEYISGSVSRIELNHKCKSLANNMRAMGVSSNRPTLREMNSERYGKFDIRDKIMVSAARLAFEIMLPTEVIGDKYFALPARDIAWIRKLFEKAVAGFYNVVLDKHEWTVFAGKKFNWSISKKTDMIDSILPSMKTDIILENKNKNQRTVIDTKFTKILTKGWYRDKTLRSGYIYQMYAYLRSQEREFEDVANNANGMLLHPSIGNMIDETVVIQDHAIRFATVDLAAEASEIRKQLLSFANTI
jgi:5-methylcytosine-specific restriction enzyme subunit McrC